ncbi:Tex family protein [Eisenibacter elegans]|uniref:Tex family protein n=1 Tax=Eisenibacter elegans TaxID=997 RepID=UPI000420DE41|nr:Tex family protein [Eisenibacter elegans]
MTQLTHAQKIAEELQITDRQVRATVHLLDEGATVPFIARYRKEVTDSLDEVFITQIRDRIAQLRELDKRREAILKSIEEQGKLTPELVDKIAQAETMTILEDLYLPYKPKRRTRATIAREKGLEPLADQIFSQESLDLETIAAAFIDEEKGVANIDEALAGARDIIAEHINEHQEARAAVRELFYQQGTFKTRVLPDKENDSKALKYKDYFEWSEPLESAPSHRILAMRRAEKEGIIALEISPDDDHAIEVLERKFVKGHHSTAEQVKLAVKDSYKRLMKSSMETEVRLESKKRAETEAIRVFADNLRELLLASPLGQKRILAIDPAFRTGCKVVCLDAQGNLLHNDVIFPDRRAIEASAKLLQYCQEYQIEAVAIGNGTASRETETFVKAVGLPSNIPIVIVNESGASVYSASEVAREEFADYDLTVRGAVSIGRRLADPLAELVKIDPKAIGVGQYQHDVDQNALKQSLDDVVVSCVNAVGVEVNTASKQLLTYVSGLGPQLAQNIVEYRRQNGPFKSRTELKKVSRLGDKAFEQCAGFLRIQNAEHPLDRSAVHPESYPVVAQMAKDLNCSITDLMEKEALRKQIDLKRYITDTVGLPTLQDILQELAKPGRDPREGFETFSFAEGVNEIEDVRVGMELNGIITNVTNFGAFVDLGVHVNGLIHISNLSNEYVANPAEVVKVNQQVKVTVLEVDLERKRIGLSLVGKDNRKGGGGGAKPSGKPAQKGSNNTRPAGRRENTQEVPEGDLQAKLAALKNKFGK